MATMAMIAPYHMQSEMYHSMAPAITLVEAHALVRNHMSVTHVDHIPIQTTGDSVYAMIITQDNTVESTTPMLLMITIATIRAMEAAMDQRYMTVQAVAKTPTWMHMDTVHASTATTEISVTKPTITRMTLAVQPLLIPTTTMDTWVITTIMVDTTVTVIQPAMDAPVLMLQTVYPAAIMRTPIADTVDVWMVTTAIIAHCHIV